MAKSIKDKNYYFDSAGITHNKETLSELLDEIDGQLHYKSGDAIVNNTGFNVSGYLSGAKTTIEFSVPVEKSMKNISNITVNALKVNVRHVGGAYIYNQVDLTQETDITLTPRKAMNNMINFSVVKDGTFDATNNIPVSVYFYAGQFKITFK